jgi:amidase
MNRRELLQLGVLGSAAALTSAAAQPKAPPFAFANASLRSLQQAQASGAVTSRGLCEQYLARIEAMNLKGPELRAILQTNPDVLAIADALDLERKQKGPRGPLHGIPVVLKDNIDTADKMQTTAGSLALLDTFPKRDASVARQLREAGAVLLGKSNMSEWANIRSMRSSSGWSARGGQGRNPYALDRSPVGSSSGSATAVAADLCAIAIGTETDGSITSPCSAHALVGMKPTVGLISRTGIIPISPTQDTAGPMARTVEDAAILLGVLTAQDPADPATRIKGRAALTDYTQGLKPDALKGVRLGVVRSMFGRGPRVRDLARVALEDLTRLGAVLVDPVTLPTNELDDPELEVLLFELKSSLNAYLADRGGAVKSLEQLIAFNEKNAELEMTWFGQELFERAQAKGPLTDPAYRSALTGNLKRSRAEGTTRRSRSTSSTRSSR